MNDNKLIVTIGNPWLKRMIDHYLLNYCTCDNSSYSWAWVDIENAIKNEVERLFLIKEINANVKFDDSCIVIRIVNNENEPYNDRPHRQFIFQGVKNAIDFLFPMSELTMHGQSLQEQTSQPQSAKSQDLHMTIESVAATEDKIRAMPKGGHLRDDMLSIISDWKKIVGKVK